MKMISVYSDSKVESACTQAMSDCFEGYIREIHPELVPEGKRTENPETAWDVKFYQLAVECGVDETILKKITKVGDSAQIMEAVSRAVCAKREFRNVINIFKEAVDSVPDKRTFLAKSWGIHQAFWEEIRSKNDFFSHWKGATIRDVKIDGDQATGWVMSNRTGIESKYQFEKVAEDQ